MKKFRRRIPSKLSAFDTVMDKVADELFPRNNRSKRGGLGGSRGPVKARRQDFALEALEPRVLLSADLSFITTTDHAVSVLFDALSDNIQIVDSTAPTTVLAE